ncbi:MAG TPA: TonB-dependent receptor [Pyrinomonadaceae bacterium]|nr:TonB-dependent receptor [Pyrinomonadaceae bacterium]
MCLSLTAIVCNAQTSQTSALHVTVKDAQGHVVPGAVCSISPTKSTKRSAITATSNEEGIATFANVAPGTYTLHVSHEGFETLAKTDVVVGEKPENEIAVVLTVATVQEVVTVAPPGEAATTVAAGSSTPAGNIKRETLRALPLATARIDEALPLVPGVIRSTKGELSIKGATEQQSALLVNGVNANDPATGNFRLNLPIDSVEAVQVFQHPYTGEYGKFIGGLTRIETRRGADHWHYELNDFLPDLRIKGGKILGIAEDQPRLNFNGPLIADRLYLSQSASYTIAKRPVRGLSYPDNETKTESQSYFSQVDLILNGHHTQSFTLGYFPKREQYVNLDFFTPKPTTPNYRQRDSSFSARDHYAFGAALLESMFSFKRFDANVWGQGTSAQTLTPTVEQGNYFATLDRRSSRIEFLEVYTSPKKEFWGGSHEIKAGFDFNHVSDELRYAAHPVRIVRADGSLAELIEFGVRPSRRIPAANNEYSAFIQDRWLVKPRLSIDLGLRFEDQRIANENNLAPRAGFAWSPTGSDRTVVRGGVGLFYDKVPLNIRGFSRYPERTVTTYGADGQTIISRINFENVLVSSKPIAPLDFRHSDRDAGFVPLNLTWNLELDQTITRRVLLRANFIDSHTRRIYVVNPELDFRGTSAIVLRSAGDATYRALEVTSRFTLKKDDAIYVSYVRSRSRGDLNDFNSYFGDLGAPVIRPNQYSNLAFDVPNRVVAWGKVSLPRRSSISPIFEWRSGFPFSARDEKQNFVGVRNSDLTRFPQFFSLDVELAKEFQLTKKYGMRLSVLGFNLTNHFNPRDVHSNISDRQFREFFASTRRYFTGGFDILF